MKKITIIFIVVFCFFYSCKKESNSKSVYARIISGDNQVSVPNQKLHEKIVILATDRNGGSKVEGITFSLDVNHGSVSSNNFTTNAKGEISIEWLLGETMGEQVLIINGLENDNIEFPKNTFPIKVTATASDADAAMFIDGFNQHVQKGEKLTEDITLQVFDINNMPIQSVKVIFSVVEGDVSNSTVITDADGKANVSWTLGQTLGKQSLSANVYKYGNTAVIDSSPVVINAYVWQYGAGVVDVEGNSYKTVIIGNQEWMAENLRVTKYSDGTPIRFINNRVDWDSLNASDAAYCAYNDDDNSLLNYGALYTWAAIMNGQNSSTSNPSDVQGACPTGWHVPSHEEWIELEGFLDSQGYSNNRSNALKAHSGWVDGKNGEDAYGFSALPANMRFSFHGDFYFFHNDKGGYGGFWWSATQRHSYSAYMRYITTSEDLSFRYYNGMVVDQKPNGVSCRCIKD